MTDFDPLHAPVGSLPPLTLVSASAGTGKTWTVTHVAARWLIEVEGRSPSQILMVTFAREAAGELKARLRQHIEEYVQVLTVRVTTGAMPDGKNEDRKKPGRKKEEWHEQLGQLTKLVDAEILLDRAISALAKIDDVNARTIHSFASLLQSRSDSFADDAKALRRQAAREVIVCAAETEKSKLEGLLTLIDSTGDKVNRLVEVLSDTLGLAAPMGGFRDDGASLVAFTAAPEITDPDDQTQKNRRDAVLFYKELSERAQVNEKRLRTLREETTFDSVIGDLVVEIRRNPEAVRGRIGTQFGLVFIDEFQDTDAGQWEIFSTLFLEGPCRSPLFVVGDAKQSIYGFRGADVTVMQRVMKMVETTPSMMSATLRRNFRSHGGLLQQVNELYSPDELAHVFVPGTDDEASVRYELVASPSKLDDGRGLFTIRDVRELELEGSVEDGCIRDVLLEIQRLTSGTLESREMPVNKEQWSLSDIVILSRRKETLRSLQWAMDRAHIPYVTPRTLSVFSSIAATQVRWLLWALADPSDIRRWRSLDASWFTSVLSGNLSATELSAQMASRGVGPLQREAMSGTLLRELLSLPGGQRHVTDLEHVFTSLAEEFPGPSTCSELLSWLEEIIHESDQANDGVDGQRRIESDENAIRLMTIHASKGLEFPVVFVVDGETLGRNGPPLVVSTNRPVGKVIDITSVVMLSKERTAATIEETIRENDRLLYVALTRAVHILTVWSDHRMADPKKCPSWSRLVEAWEGNEATVGPRWVRVKQEEFTARRLGRFGENSEHLGNAIVLPQHRSTYEPLRRWSYSTLHGQTAGDGNGSDGGSNAEDDTDERNGLHRRGRKAFGDERGAQLGDALHGAFEDIVGIVDMTQRERIDDILLRHFRSEGCTMSEKIGDAFVRLLARPLGAPWGNVCLNDYVRQGVEVASELRFTIPLQVARSSKGVLQELSSLVVEHDPNGPFVEHFGQLASSANEELLSEGYLTGSIDLVAPTLGTPTKYHVLDYKSNGLTVTEDFSSASLVTEMAASGYPLQALLYSVALHRHLQGALRGYDPTQHLGGATYYYLRGASLFDAAPDEGVFHWAIPAAVTTRVSALLTRVDA